MVETTPLNASWRVAGFEPGGADTRALSLPGADTGEWIEMSLPGDVNAALVRAGRMPDPHFGDNARRCFWVTANEWVLRTEFAGDAVDADGRVDLCLDGLDGHVDVFLNGEPLGSAFNAFRLHRLAVDPAALRDRNVLLLRFRSIDETMGGPRKDELGGWDDGHALMRKPAFNFGWDWALPLPSIGVLGGVWLESYAGPRLQEVSVKTHLTGRVDFKFKVNTAARDAGYHLDVRLRGHGADVARRVDRPGRCRSHVSLQVDGPALWWPRGMGDQALYDFEVELVVGDEVVERRAGRVGFREVRIEEDPFTEDAGPGISFWLSVNGRRVFCKGGNWVPLEVWPAEATEEQYVFYLGKAAEADFNMLRVWGGGVYEREVFHDLCDRLGIMVWQDFMFASSAYSVDALGDEIIAEAEYQIRRLRHRPSIVLWCGCNEDVFSWDLPEDAGRGEGMADTGVYSERGPGEGVNRYRDDPRIYTMILRGLVSKLGLGVPYIESSPQSYEDAGNMPESGNSHLSSWKYALFDIPDHPEDFRRLFDQTQSFDSEFCIQGPCDERSLKQFLPAERLWPPDEMWTFHVQRGHRRIPHHEQTLQIAGGVFGAVDSLQDYVKHGQATHVEMMRAEFESARRERPNNGGTMMWMFNDCWPTSNWSIIDYYRRPKPAYYAAKRACAPLLPIILERKGRIEFFLSNDTPRPVQGRLSFGKARLDGEVVWSEERTVETPGVSTARFHELPRQDMDLRPDEFFFIDGEVGGVALPPVTYFPDGWKHVPWPTPAIKARVARSEEQADGWFSRVRVRTDVYARFCHLRVAPSVGEHWLSDNFYDLPAAHEREIEVRTQRPLAPDHMAVGHWGSEWP